MSMPASDETKTASLFRATVVENTEVARNHYRLTFSHPPDAALPRPGQFYMLGTGVSGEPLLKRPFCYIDGDRENITILYRVRGKGTRLLAERAPGAVLDVVGPLGNAYPGPRRGTVPVVVAGGIGMASVFPHIRALRGRAVVLYGARNAEELLLLDEVKRSAAAVHVSTLDGSRGRPGTVLDLMGELAQEESYTLYVCGPHAMLEAVGARARDRGLRGYASLEEFMACGVGACMGCVVRTVRGYERVCREGPVFRLEDIVF